MDEPEGAEVPDRMEEAQTASDQESDAVSEEISDKEAEEGHLPLQRLAQISDISQGLDITVCHRKLHTFLKRLKSSICQMRI